MSDNDKPQPVLAELGEDEDPNGGTPMQGTVPDRTRHGMVRYGYGASGSVLTQSGLENND